MTESRRRLAAIMFTDMVGYSALAQSDEATALAVLERHNALLRPIFAKFSGREVKTVGDAFLIEFDSALDASKCALEIQRTLREYDRSAPESWRIQVRIGIHVGDVVQTDGDVLGDAVNIASRIQPLAEPGGICLTQQVYDQIQNKVTTPLQPMPPVALKNIRVPMRVYRFVLTGDGPGSTPGAADRPGGRQIAVLPLANISPDARDEYFADGLTEELISVLSHVRGLSVIARTSVMPYKTASRSVAQIGAELGVDTVLEGSVRKAGNRIRITLQLIDVGTQHHIWADSYNREVDDVFAVQSDVAERTADALRLELLPEKGSGRKLRPTENGAAYDSYLRGLVASRREIGGGLEEAVQCFDRATKLDPNFAEAYAAWATLYVGVAGDYRSFREVMPRARELAARALELDPDSSEAHSALGNIAMQFDQDWSRSESEFRRSIALNPSGITAHQYYALLLLALGRFEEAREIVRRLVQLDPGGDHASFLAWVDLESGNLDAGIRALEAQVAESPSSAGAHVVLGLACFAIGRRSEAIRAADTAPPPANPVEEFDLALLNAAVGRPEPARKILDEADRGTARVYVSANDRAMIHAALGERERALDLLEQDFRDGDRVLWLYHRSAVYDSVREDPRFGALLRQYGIPDRALRHVRTDPTGGSG